MKEKVVIYGITEFAQFVFHYFKKDFNCEVVGFTVESKYLDKNSLNNLPVVPFEDIEKIYPNTEYSLFIAIGPTKMNKIREQYFNMAKEKGYKLYNYISNSAILDSPIGENNFITDQCIVNSGVKFGNNNMVYEQVIICVGATIFDHNYIAPRAIIGTNCVVKNNIIIGMNSVIKTDVCIENETLIGAQCYIAQNTLYKSVYGVKTSPMLGCVSDKVKV